MTDTTPSPLDAYKAWRAALSPADQTRWAYLLTDAAPLLQDVIKSQVDGMLTGPFAGLESSIANGLVDGAVSGAMAQLKAP
jgi:hypothetical protein